MFYVPAVSHLVEFEFHLTRRLIWVWKAAFWKNEDRDSERRAGRKTKGTSGLGQTSHLLSVSAAPLEGSAELTVLTQFMSFGLLCLCEWAEERLIDREDALMSEHMKIPFVFLSCLSFHIYQIKQWNHGLLVWYFKAVIWMNMCFNTWKHVWKKLIMKVLFFFHTIWMTVL